MEFPQLSVTKPLTEFEVEALRSLYTACLQLRYEVEAARVRTMGLHQTGDIAVHASRGQAFTHHAEVLHELSNASHVYERAVGLLAWQHAGALVVLGARLKQRCLERGPALGVDTVMRLCDEPMLGELRDALEVPTLPRAGNISPSVREVRELQRQEVRGHLESVFYNAARVKDRHTALPDGVVAAFRLSEVSPPDMDPLYEGSLGQLQSYAEGLPFEIASYLEGAARLPRPAAGLAKPGTIT